MKHPWKAAAKAGSTFLAALAHLGWPVLCAVGMFVVATGVLIWWILKDQGRSDRAVALISAWRGSNNLGSKLPDKLAPSPNGEDASHSAPAPTSPT